MPAVGCLRADSARGMSRRVGEQDACEPPPTARFRARRRIGLLRGDCSANHNLSSRSSACPASAVAHALGAVDCVLRHENELAWCNVYFETQRAYNMPEAAHVASLGQPRHAIL